MPNSPTPTPRSATVHRLRPRNPRLADALQLVLQLDGLPEPVKIDLNERLAGLSDETTEAWRFLMITAAPEVMGRLLKAIGEGPRPYSTLAVWSVLSPYVRRDTGEIITSQRTLAKTAGVDKGDVCRALARLVEIGALLAIGRGRYKLNPNYAWNGSLETREHAVKAAAPRLALVNADQS